MAVKVTKDNLIDLLIDSTNDAKQRSYFSEKAATTPQLTGGSTYDMSKVPTTVSPKNPVDATPKSQTVVPRSDNYLSSRFDNLSSNFNMGGKDATGSWQEVALAPKAYVAGFVEGTEGMAKAPLLKAAEYYKDKDTYLTGREAEGTKTLNEQVQKRSEEYKKEFGASNKKKAEDLATLAEKIDLYDPKQVLTRREDEMISSSPTTAKAAEEGAKNRKSVRSFLEDVHSEMADLQKSGVKFSLADAAYTMGQMAPSQIAGGVAGNLITDFAKGTELGKLMASNLGDSVKAADTTKDLLNPISSVDDLMEAPSMSAVRGAMEGTRLAVGANELKQIGQTAGSLGLMYGQVYGNTYDQARAAGADINTALEKAASTALVETGTEVLGGGIPGMGGGVGTRIVQGIAEKTAAKLGGSAVSKVVPQFVSTIAEALSSEAGEMFVDIVGEGVEEMISEWYGPQIDRNTGFNPDAEDASAEDILFAGLTGSLISAFMSGGMAVLQHASQEHTAYVVNKKISDVTGIPQARVEKMSSEEIFEEVINNISAEEAVKAGIYSEEDLADLHNRVVAMMYLNKFTSIPTMAGAKSAFEPGGALYDRYKDVITPEILEGLNNIKGMSQDRNLLARSGYALSIANGVPSWDVLDQMAHDIAEYQIKPLIAAKVPLPDILAHPDLREPFFIHQRMISPKSGFTEEQAQKYFEDLIAQGYDSKTATETMITDGILSPKRIAKFVDGTPMVDMFYGGTPGNTYLWQDAYRKYRKKVDERKAIIDAQPGELAAIPYKGRTRVVSFPEYLDVAAEIQGLDSKNEFSDESLRNLREDFDNLAKKTTAQMPDYLEQLDKKYDGAGFNFFVDNDPGALGWHRYDWDSGRSEIAVNSEYSIQDNTARQTLNHEVSHAIVKRLEAEDTSFAKRDAYFDRVFEIARRVGFDVSEYQKHLADEYGEDGDWTLTTQNEMASNIIEMLLGDSTLILDALDSGIGNIDDVLSLIEDTAEVFTQAEGSERVDAKSELETVRAARDGSLRNRISNQLSRATGRLSSAVRSAIGKTEVAETSMDSAKNAIRLAEADLPSTSARMAEDKSLLTAVEEAFSKKEPKLPTKATELGFKTVLDSKKQAGKTKTKQIGDTKVSYADDITRVELAGLSGVYVRINQQTHNNGDVTRNFVAEADSTHPLTKDGKHRLFSADEMDTLHALGFHSNNGVWVADYKQSMWDSMVAGNAEALRRAKRNAPKNDIGDLHWYKTSLGDGSEAAWIPSANGGEIAIIFRNDKGFRRGAREREYYKYVGGEYKGVKAPGLGFKRLRKGSYGNALYAKFTPELWETLGLEPMTAQMRQKMNETAQIRRAMFSLDGRIECKLEGLKGYSIGYNTLNNSLELYDKDGTCVGAMPYSEAVLELAFEDSNLTAIFAEKTAGLKRLEDLFEGLDERTRTELWNRQTPEAEEKGDERAKAEAEKWNQTEGPANKRSSDRQQEDAERADRVIYVKFKGSDEWQVFPRGIANELAGVTSGGKLKSEGDTYNGEQYYGPFIDPVYIDALPDSIRLDPTTGMPRQLRPESVVDVIKDGYGKTVWNSEGYRTDVFYPREGQSHDSENPYEGIFLDRGWFADNKKWADEYARGLTEGTKKEGAPTTEAGDILPNTGKTAAEYEAPLGAGEDDYGERLGGVLDDVAGRGALTKEGAEQTKGVYSQESYGESADTEGGNVAEAAEEIKTTKRPKKPEKVTAAEEGARLIMEAIAAEEEGRKGSGEVIRPLYLYSMEEARRLCVGDSDAVILAKMEVSKISAAMREAAKNRDFDLYQQLSEKREAGNGIVKLLQSLPLKKTGTSTFDMKKYLEELREATKGLTLPEEEFEGLTIPEDQVVSDFVAGTEEGVQIKGAYGTYDPGALSEPVFNDGRLNSDGYALNDEQKRRLEGMRGALSEDGTIQVYYTNYVDEDGAFVLGTSPATVEGRSDAVYAAIKHPLYAETADVASYPGVGRAIADSIKYLGLDATGIKIPNFTDSSNVFDVVMEAADNIASVSELTRNEVIGEILYNLGIDGVIYPDGAVIYDINNLVEAYPSSGDTMQTRGYRYNDGSVERSAVISSNELISSVRSRVNELGDKRKAYIEKYGEEAYIESVNRAYDNEKGEFGTIDGKGVIPTKNVEGDTKITRAAQNIWDSLSFGQLDDNNPLVTAYKELVISGILSYVPETDSQKLGKAGEWLQGFATGTVDNPKELTIEDFGRACQQWIKNAESGAITEQDVMNGAQLLAEFANYARAENGNPDAFSDGMLSAFQKVAALVELTGSKAGKLLHAYKLIKNATPQGKLYYYEHMASRLAEELDEAKGILKGKLKKHELHGYKVPEHLAQRIKDLQPGENFQAEMDAIEEEIVKDIASKVPATLESRIRAYRYLCMLGNVKTHIRNMASNAIMAGVKNIARRNSAVLEDVFAKKQEGAERTKSWKKWREASRETKRATKEFSEADAKRSIEMLQFGGKRGFDDKVRQMRKSFGDSPVGKFFDAVSKWNGDLLEKEDLMFLSKEYAAAMTWYMIANDWTPEHFYETSEQAAIDYSKAQDYALKQAWEATYRQANLLATKLNELEKSHPGWHLLIEGVVPFKRTPMNILKAGVNYSALGMFRGLYKTFDALTTGETTASEAADILGKGMSGTGIMILGAMLAHLGWLKAGGGDDKNEEYYDQMLGKQKYSFTTPDLRMGDYHFALGGRNYTIDWITPVSMPLFAGVEAYNAYREIKSKDDDYNMVDLMNGLLDAIAQTADPITNLSMLSGVKDSVSVLASGKAGPIDVFMNAGENYALQFMPTMEGQAARFINPQRKSTYGSGEGYVGGKGMETFINKVKNKSLPYNIADRLGLVEGNAAYIDQWGRKEEGERNPIIRAVEQFAAPWYARSYNSTEVDDNLAKLYKANGGDTSIFPKTPQNYFSLGGKKYTYSAKEYEKAKTTVGKLSYSGVNSAFNSREFKTLDPAAQTKVIDSIYTYARLMAKSEYANAHGLKLSDSERSTLDKINEVNSSGMSIGRYYAIKEITSGLKSKDKKAELRDLGIPKDMWDLF